MFERLFQYPRVLARHREAPFLAEREQFLQHCAHQGMAQGTLTHAANELLVIVRRLDLAAAEGPIKPQQIEASARPLPWIAMVARALRASGDGLAEIPGAPGNLRAKALCWG